PHHSTSTLFPYTTLFRSLHRTLGAHREQRRAEFVSEGITLSAECPAVRRGDDADAPAREAEHLLHLAMEVVRHLCAGPERQLSVAVVRRDGGVRLERRVGVALEEEPVLAHMV